MATSIRLGKLGGGSATGGRSAYSGGGSSYLSSSGGSGTTSGITNRYYNTSSTSGSLESEAKKAVEEAKAKQEASKASALGYYDTLQPYIGATGKALGTGYSNQVNYLNTLADEMKNFDLNTTYQNQLNLYNPLLQSAYGLSENIISDEQQRQLLADRRAQLSASSQNLAGMFGDADSGYQTGQRLGIAQNMSLAAANLPIELQLEVGQANRAAQLERLGQIESVASKISNVESDNILRKLGLLEDRAGLASLQVGAEQEANLNLLKLLGIQTDIAGAKSDIQQSYQYDPGLDYINALAYAQGQQSQTVTGGTTTGGTIYKAGGTAKTPTSQGYGYNPTGSKNATPSSSPSWLDTSNWQRTLGRIK